MTINLSNLLNDKSYKRDDEFDDTIAYLFNDVCEMYELVNAKKYETKEFQETDEIDFYDFNTLIRILIDAFKTEKRFLNKKSLKKDFCTINCSEEKFPQK